MHHWIGVHLPRLPIESFCPTWYMPVSDNGFVVLEKGRVLDADAAARAQGVVDGMRRGGVLTLAPNADLRERELTRHFDGLWCITTVTGYSDITISPDAIRKLPGKSVEIGPGRVRVADIDCVPDTMRVDMRATPSLLTAAYHANQSEVGIPRRTLILAAGLCGPVFRAGSGIIVTQGGAFYRATRITNGLRER